MEEQRDFHDDSVPSKKPRSMDSVAGFLIYERTLGSSPVLHIALVIAGSRESQVFVLFMNLLKAGSSFSSSTKAAFHLFF